MIIWIPGTITQIQRKLRQISKFAPYAFVTCGNHYVQFFDFAILDAKRTVRAQNWTKSEMLSVKTSTKYGRNPYITIIVLNSVSRSHFYRSLPETLKLFQKINLEPRNHYKVLDFELMNAHYDIASENFRQLFWSGQVSESKFNASSETKPLVPFGALLRHFKSKGKLELLLLPKPERVSVNSVRASQKT